MGFCAWFGHKSETFKVFRGSLYTNATAHSEIIDFFFDLTDLVRDWFCFLLCIFLNMRYTAFIDIFRVLANTTKTLAVFGDLLQL